ncbi:MAG TPA: peptidase inhibitor family I36 protein [Pseudonocardiaceae bacterium]|nr:peptidase inhibitor family I36 protein [Pseudonocardiaceae bacterium]
MRHLRKALTIAGAALAITAPLMAIGTPAFAAARDGVCDSGEFCYYFFSGEQGSLSDFTGSVANYGTTEPTCFDFKGPGTGQGQCIKNNAESVWNRSSRTVTVFFNSNFGGPFQNIEPGQRIDLIPALFDNNASHEFN